MRLALDVMGGDHGTRPLVEGALAALRDSPGLELILVGRSGDIEPELAAAPADLRPRLGVEHASEVVAMTDLPTAALRRKKDSSIRRGAELVAAGQADGLISAGSTGAVAATMAVVVGLIAGVDRAAIATILPTLKGPTLLLDVGASVDCKPHWLLQFAIMGRLYSACVLGTREPRVGLLNIGEEKSKGNELTREVHQLLAAQPGLGFIGNVEGKDLFGGGADVVVCDGFVGNVVLKSAESVPPIVLQVMREEIGRSLPARLGMLLARAALRRAWHRLDWESYGGAPLLGVDGACIICHGRSGPKAIGNAIRVARDFVAGRVKQRIAENIKGVG